MQPENMRKFKDNITELYANITPEMFQKSEINCKQFVLMSVVIRKTF